MELKKTYIKKKCDRCFSEIGFTGNDRITDEISSASGDFDYCQDCYLEMLTIQQVEKKASEAGLPAALLAARWLELYKD